jgi:hypothetical protein
VLDVELLIIEVVQLTRRIHCSIQIKNTATYKTQLSRQPLTHIPFASLMKRGYLWSKPCPLSSLAVFPRVAHDPELLLSLSEKTRQ